MFLAKNTMLKRTIAFMVVFTVIAVFACPVVFGSGGGNLLGNEATGMISTLVNFIFQIFRWIGVLLAAWAIGQLVLAFKNEDADSKSRAIMLLLVSIALIGAKTVFDQLNLI